MSVKDPNFSDGYFLDDPTATDSGGFKSISQLIYEERMAGEQEIVESKGDFFTGVDAGVESLFGLFDAATAAFGELIGDEDMRDRNIAQFQERNQKIAQLTQGRITDIDEVFADDGEGKISKAVDYAQYTLGQLAPFMLESVAGAIAGATIGSSVPGAGTVVGGAAGLVGKTAVKKAIIAYAKDKTADKAEEQLARSAIKKFYGTIGAAAANYPIGVGDVYQTTVDAGEPDAMTAFARGVPYAALDTVADMIGIGRFMSPGAGNMATRAGKGVLAQAPVEGLTEAGQEEILIQTHAGIDPNFDPDGAEAWKQRRNAFAAGMLGGTVIGGAGGVLRGQDKTVTQDTTPPRDTLIDADQPPAPINDRRHQLPAPQQDRGTIVTPPPPTDPTPEVPLLPSPQQAASSVMESPTVDDAVARTAEISRQQSEVKARVKSRLQQRQRKRDAKDRFDRHNQERKQAIESIGQDGEKLTLREWMDLRKGPSQEEFTTGEEVRNTALAEGLAPIQRENTFEQAEAEQSAQRQADIDRAYETEPVTDAQLDRDGNQQLLSPKYLAGKARSKTAQLNELLRQRRVDRDASDGKGIEDLDVETLHRMAEDGDAEAAAVRDRKIADLEKSIKGESKSDSQTQTTPAPDAAPATATKVSDESPAQAAELERQLQEKRQKLDESRAGRSKDANALREKLSGMSVAKLKEVAKGSGVSIPSKAKKADIVEALAGMREAADTFNQYDNIDEVEAAVEKGDISKDDLARWANTVAERGAKKKAPSPESVKMNVREVEKWGLRTKAFEMNDAPSRTNTKTTKAKPMTQAQKDAAAKKKAERLAKQNKQQQRMADAPDYKHISAKESKPGYGHVTEFSKNGHTAHLTYVSSTKETGKKGWHIDYNYDGEGARHLEFLSTDKVEAWDMIDDMFINGKFSDKKLTGHIDKPTKTVTEVQEDKVEKPTVRLLPKDERDGWDLPVHEVTYKGKKYYTMRITQAGEERGWHLDISGFGEKNAALKDGDGRTNHYIAETKPEALQYIKDHADGKLTRQHTEIAQQESGPERLSLEGKGNAKLADAVVAYVKAAKKGGIKDRMDKLLFDVTKQLRSTLKATITVEQAKEFMDRTMKNPKGNKYVMGTPHDSSGNVSVSFNADLASTENPNMDIVPSDATYDEVPIVHGLMSATVELKSQNKFAKAHGVFKDVLAAAVQTLLDAGMNPAFFEEIAFIGTTLEAVGAHFNVENRYLAVHEDLLSAAAKGNEGAKLAVARFIAHELTHSMDFNVGGQAMSTQTADLDLEIIKNDDGSYNFNTDDNVMGEVLDVWLNDVEGLNGFLSYPLGSAVREFNDDVANGTDYGQRWIRFEVFAQLGAMYYTAPTQMKRVMPKAYAYMEGIFNAYDSRPRAGQAKRRDGVQSAVRASGPGLFSRVTTAAIRTGEGTEGRPASERVVRDGTDGPRRGRGVEDDVGHRMEIDRLERTLAEKTTLSAAEKKIISAFARKHKGITAKEVTQQVRAIKAQYPLEEGWAPLTLKSVVLEKGVVTPSFEAIPYTYKTGDRDLMISHLVSIVKEVRRLAARGNKNAKVILRQEKWYSDMTERLRHEYGSLGDLFADLLGATSPNTPVLTNWNFAVDALGKALAGDYDSVIDDIAVWAEETDRNQEQLAAYKQAQRDQGRKVKDIEKDDEYKRLNAAVEVENIPLQSNGKKFGVNSRHVAKALGDLWRIVRTGMSAKARNFSGNLIGFTDEATIDVWAARLLQDLANQKRVPPRAEGAVEGDHLTGSTLEQPKVGSDFGFGQFVFREAAAELGMRPSDLQALVWFYQKEVWAKNNWTNMQGEGGSFDEQARKNPVDRFIGMLSMSQSEYTQGVDYDPTDEHMARENGILQNIINNIKGMIAGKSMSTLGYYAGDSEKSFDIEAVAEAGTSPDQLWSEMLRIAEENNQDAVGLSRVIPTNEDVDPLVHRPGLEVYFNKPTSVEALAPVMKLLEKKGWGFTLATDSRRTADVRAGKVGNVTGIRVTYVPEFVGAPDNFDGMTDADLTEHMKNVVDELHEIRNDILNLDNVSHANMVHYETRIVFNEEYANEASRYSQGSPQEADSQEWGGRSIREGFEATNLRNGERGTDLNQGDLSPDGQVTGNVNMTGWHGNGNPERITRFSTAFVDTGEGSQMEGWGLYFSNTKKIGEWYRDALSKSNTNILYKGRQYSDIKGHGKGPERMAVKKVIKRMLDDGIDAYDALELITYEVRTDIARKMNRISNGNVDGMLTRDGLPMKDAIQQRIDSLWLLADIWDNMDAAEFEYADADQKGRLYQVDLAPDEDEYLLWDEPIINQSPLVIAALADAQLTINSDVEYFTDEAGEEYHWTELADGELTDEVRQAAIKAAEKFGGSAKWTTFGELERKRLTGKKLYWQIRDAFNRVDDWTGEWIASQFKQTGNKSVDADGFVKHMREYRNMDAAELTSRYLHSIGIRGNKYLDGDSRSDGKGTYNYVIFNDEDVSIQNVEANVGQDDDSVVIRLGNRSANSTVTLERSTQDVSGDPTFADPETEKRFNEAQKGVAGGRTIGNILSKLYNTVKAGFTRHYENLPNTGFYANAFAHLRAFESAPETAGEEAVRRLKEVLGEMSSQEYDIFERKVIMDDLIYNVDKDIDLPFGWTQQTLAADAQRVDDIVAQHPAIQRALTQRKQLIDEVGQRLVDEGIMSAEQLANPHYFRHQVLFYAMMKDSLQQGATNLKDPNSPYSFGRKGSLRDINANYLEVEYGFIQMALTDIKAVETIDKIKRDYDITDRLQAEAVEQGLNPKKVKAPEGYTFWQPDKGRMFFMGNAISDSALNHLLDSLDDPGNALPGVDKSMMSKITKGIRKQMMVGPNKPGMIIPTELRDTMEKLRQPADESFFDHIFAVPLKHWKQWTLISPRRVLKYNINNMSGDLDAVIAGQPGVVRKLPQAIKELWAVMKGAEPSTQYREAVERGVFASGLSAQEIPEINRMSEFEELAGDTKGGFGVVRLMTKAWRASRDYTQFRENWMRYAAYIYYNERLQNGDPMEDIGYGASLRDMVDGTTNLKDRAALLSRELVGDYGAISTYGEGIRAKVIPFYSWMEINTKRYVRFTRNAFAAGAVKGGVTGAWITASLSARMFILYTMVQMFNNLFFSEEEDELDTVERVKLHLNLGRNADGQIVLLKTQGALSDALSWIGWEESIEAIKAVESGLITWPDLAGEIAKNVAKAPVNKVAMGLTPLIKTPIEMFSGVSWFPDITSPRPIKDKWREGWRLFGLENEYDIAFDKPTKGYGKSLKKLVVYERDVGEINYYAIKKMSADYNETVHGKEGYSTYLTPRSMALRYYKMALKYGDTEAAAKYKKELVEIYGSVAKFRESYKKSIRKAHPLGSIAIKDRKDFMSRMTAEEKKRLEKAIDWYEEIYK